MKSGSLSEERLKVKSEEYIGGYKGSGIGSMGFDRGL